MMIASSLQPVGLEIRLLGTLTKDELVSLSKLVVRRRNAEEVKGSWTPVNEKDDWDPHHRELGGYKLVTPLEIGTIGLSGITPSNGQASSFTLQVYASLVPCYQVWLRLPAAAPDGNKHAPLEWGAIRDAYRRLLNDVDGFGLNPQVTLWSVTVAQFPWELERPEGPHRQGGLVSPEFFDQALGEEMSDFQAASWYGTSFVGLHLAEGKEHYLVVDGMIDRPFRVSQFFYYLIGQTQLHNLAETIHQFARSLEEDPELGAEFPPAQQSGGTSGPNSSTTVLRSATDRLNVGELEREIDQSQRRRSKMGEAAITLSKHLAHAEMLREFVRYHTSGLTSDSGERFVESEPAIPKIGAEVEKDLRMRYDGPLNESVQWAREIMRRAREKNETREELLRDRMNLLMTRRLWRLQLMFLSFTLVALGLSLYSIFR